MKGKINMQKDYRIKVTIRNDRLLTAMEEMGYSSMAQFTQAHGLEYQRTGEIFNGKLSSNTDNKHSFKLKQGQAIFFASWLQHRVKPVTRGERISLVMWFGGPSFK